MGAQTSYAELADMVQSLAAARFSMLRGSFHRRMIKGRAYHYFAFRDVDGQGRSAYVGPETPDLLQLIEEYRKASPAASLKSLAPRARACLALGCTRISTQDLRAIMRLAGYGFFEAGGVLVGHQAFVAIGNMLGVRWTGGNQKVTNSLEGLALAVPVDLRLATASVREALEMGRLPIQEFSGLNAEKTPINIFTPAMRSSVATTNSGDRFVPQPLGSMALLLQGTVQGVVISPSGACPVTLPEPARYAVHELLACGDTPAIRHADALVHLFHAAALIEWHVAHARTEQLNTAWHEALRGEPAWRHAATIGLEQLRKTYPAAAAGLIR